jgi:hypothetical protein
MRKAVLFISFMLSGFFSFSMEKSSTAYVHGRYHEDEPEYRHYKKEKHDRNCRRHHERDYRKECKRERRGGDDCRRDKRREEVYKKYPSSKVPRKPRIIIDPGGPVVIGG